MRTFIVICLAWGLLGLANRAPAAPPKKVLELIKDLKDRDPKNRAFAAEELGSMAEVRLTDVKPAIPALLAALKDKDAAVRKAVIDALGKAEPEPREVVPAYIDIVRRDKDPTVRLAAVTALGQIGPPAKAAIPALKEAQKAIKERERLREKEKDKDKEKNQAMDMALSTEITAALQKIQAK
jgi:HEAT repeat protein